MSFGGIYFGHFPPNPGLPGRMTFPTLRLGEKRLSKNKTESQATMKMAAARTLRDFPMPPKMRSRGVKIVIILYVVVQWYVFGCLYQVLNWFPSRLYLCPKEVKCRCGCDGKSQKERVLQAWRATWLILYSEGFLCRCYSSYVISQNQNRPITRGTRWAIYMTFSVSLYIRQKE